MLEIKKGTGGYGKTVIIRDINVVIEKGQKVALLGRNGVGKTTLIKYIMRLLDLHRGEIFMSGQPLDHKISSRAKARIGYVPQGRYVFERLSVAENILSVAYANQNNAKENLESSFSLFPILKEHRNRDAGSLSGGQQQILAIARALAIQPKILLLDEPSEGIQPSIVENIAEALTKLSAEKKIAFLIAEQNLDFCMSIADKAFIMDQGKIVKETDKEELNNDKHLLKELLAI